MALFWLSVAVIGGFSAFWFINQFMGKEDWRLFGPFGVLLLSYNFYCVAGPMVFMNFTGMDIVGVDGWSVLNDSALAALVSFICVCIGYYFKKRPGQVYFPEPVNDVRIRRIAIFMTAFFWSCVLISKKFSIPSMYNIFGKASEADVESVVDLAGFQMYLYLTISTLICPVVMLLTASGKEFANKVVTLVFTLNIFAIFLSTGFRVRIAFLLLLIINALLLRARSTLKWSGARKVRVFTKAFAYAIVGVVLLVLMSSARQYGRGLDMEQLSATDKSQVFVNAFNDTGIYFSAGAVKQYMDGPGTYTYLETYKAAALRIIPQGIIGEKPLPQTIRIIREGMGGTEASENAGCAVPFYMENYISFGWIGLVMGSLVLGVICGAVENFAVRSPNYVAKIFYILISGFAFIYFHRGYFPQQLDFFMFTVGVPCFILYQLDKQRRFVFKPMV